MATTNEPAKKIHHGRNVRRFREMMGLKQEAFAEMLGEKWSQRTVSSLEGKEEIEDDVLAEVAKILKIPMESIKNFDEERAIYAIQNNYSGSTVTSNCNFNPVDKVLELVDKNEKLYEALLKSEREKNELFERLLREKM